MFKSKLQEYCQKHKIPLPVYNTERCGGDDHSPQWCSSLSLSGKIITGEIKYNKTEAENSVAKMVMGSPGYLSELLFSSEEVEKIKPISFPENSVMLIDLENMPKFLDQNNIDTTNIDIYVFVNKYHPLATRNFDAPVNKIISEATGTNGTDICIQVFVGTWLIQNRYKKYYIVTKDKFALSLVQLIQSDKYGWAACDAEIIAHNF